MTTEAPLLLESLARSETWKLVARVARIVEDVDLAEEIAQDALVAALEAWPRDGAPENPGAWLMATAKNRALDALRKKKKDAHAAPDVARHEEARRATPDDAPDAVTDEQLRLVLVCCHPDLPREQQVALTLRLVGGLTAGEIARAFVAEDAAIQQRIVRAKRTIRERALLFEAPGGRSIGARLPAVLEVIYLVFNEGYAAASGDALIRRDLCAEALRMGRALVELVPREAEALGLVALMEIQASREGARVAADGSIVLLADQDRTKWDRAAIARGEELLARARELGGRGAYVLQAEIAACHARAARAEETDWGRIASLYAELADVSPSPIVELNRAVAVSFAAGPAAGLALLDGMRGLGAALAGYHLLPATRADMLRRMHRFADAAREYRRARDLATNERERDFLALRAEEAERAASG